jgi:hypothetical protein
MGLCSSLIINRNPPLEPRSFDALFNDIWRPQSIAFSHVIYQGQQPDPSTMSERQYNAYLAEARRLRSELERDNPVLTRLRESVTLSS